MESPYDNLTLHYYTGTGNSYRVAVWCKNIAQLHGLTTTVGQIVRGVPPESAFLESRHMLGLCYPTHAFTAPWNVIRHCLRMPKGSGTPVFLIQCRAGWYFGPWPLPGIDGSGTWLLALILTLKGYRCRGLMGLDLPSNWIALHWGLSDGHVEVMSAKAQHKAERFSRTVFAGNTWFKWEGFLQLALGILLLPITVAYLIMGRFFLAKLLFPSYRCTGCGLCEQHCPNRAIRMLKVGGKKCWPYWTWHCESCMRCMAFCPERAVECSHPLAFGIWWVASIPLAFWLLRLVLPHWPASEQGFLGFLIRYVYRLSVVMIVYLVFALINRIGFMNRLFSVLTPTYFFRRYHEPRTKLSDFSRPADRAPPNRS